MSDLVGILAVITIERQRFSIIPEKQNICNDVNWFVVKNLIQKISPEQWEILVILLLPQSYQHYQELKFRYYQIMSISHSTHKAPCSILMVIIFFSYRDWKMQSSRTIWFVLFENEFLKKWKLKKNMPLKT